MPLAHLRIERHEDSRPVIDTDAKHVPYMLNLLGLGVKVAINGACHHLDTRLLAFAKPALRLGRQRQCL